MTTSYVLRERNTKRAVYETWNEKLAAQVNESEKYEAVPIMQHLQEINTSARDWMTERDPMQP